MCMFYYQAILGKFNKWYIFSCLLSYWDARTPSIKFSQFRWIACLEVHAVDFQNFDIGEFGLTKRHSPRACSTKLKTHLYRNSWGPPHGLRARQSFKAGKKLSTACASLNRTEDMKICITYWIYLIWLGSRTCTRTMSFTRLNSLISKF